MPLTFIHGILPLLAQFLLSVVSEISCSIGGDALSLHNNFTALQHTFFSLKCTELKKSHKWDEGCCYKDGNCHLPKKKMTIKLFLPSTILRDLATANCTAVKQNSRT